jgi:hypothetical protein
MKSKKSTRRTAPPREQGPPPASDRLIEAMHDAVNRARAKKFARAPEPSNQHLNPFSERPAEESGEGQEKRTVDAAR